MLPSQVWLSCKSLLELLIQRETTLAIILLLCGEVAIEKVEFGVLVDFASDALKLVINPG